MSKSRPAKQQGTAAQVVVRPEFAKRSASSTATAAETLLAVEAEIRRLEQVTALQFHLVNETRRFVNYQQAYLLTTPTSANCRAVSSVAAPDRNSPHIRWIESLVRRLSKAVDISTTVEFALPAYGDHDKHEVAEYPFPHFLWIPLKDVGGSVFAGMLLASEQPWRSGAITLAERLAQTYAHAWLALVGRRRMPAYRKSWSKWLWPITVLGVLVAGFIPVPMTTLAPAEIVARDPAVIAAPLRGIVKSIDVTPNAEVTQGHVLLRFDDTDLRNELAVAEKTLLVAAAAHRQIEQGSLVDARFKRDLAVAEAELTLKQAERDYVRERLAQTKARAPTAGLAIFTDPDEWVGRPVSTGERIMEIADPARVKLRIELAVDDSIALANGSDIRVYLDSDPLNPVRAQVEHASYHAQATPDGRLAYRVEAKLNDGTTPRIGLRGTAQLFGEDVPLYFFLLRRPISSLRQSLGF